MRRREDATCLFCSSCRPRACECTISTGANGTKLAACWRTRPTVRLRRSQLPAVRIVRALACNQQAARRFVVVVVATLRSAVRVDFRARVGAARACRGHLSWFTLPPQTLLSSLHHTCFCWVCVSFLCELAQTSFARNVGTLARQNHFGRAWRIITHYVSFCWVYESSKIKETLE